VALGLLVAPSLAGLFLGLAAACAFLARHPFKIVAGDRRRGRRFPRTPAAEAFLALYGALALASALAAVATAPSFAFVLPLLAAAPLVAAQLFFDAKGRSRALAPELSGSAGLAAVATGIALAGGLAAAPAFALWALLAGRAVPSILYVRARLRLLHGEAPAKLPTTLAHAAALVLVSLLAWSGLAPPLAALAFLVLLARAARGLAAPRGEGSAKRVGVAEIIYGAMTVLAAAGLLTG